MPTRQGRRTDATLAGDGTWKQLGLPTPAAAGGTTMSVEVLVSLASGTSAYVDDVSLQQS